MSDQENNGAKPGVIKRLWKFLWSPSGVYSLGTLLIVGFVAGILFWGGFHWTLEMTNKEKFCVSCHEMQKNYVEYQDTVHYNNHSGVRAVCADCHVPKEWSHKMKAKVVASKDVFYTITGKINTPEKYEEHRLDMASLVWKKMKKSDSRECRNCHNFEFMDFTIQETRASKEHQRALDNDMTCIDCHQGIAHKLPPNYLEAYRGVVEELEASAAPLLPKTQDFAANGKEIQDFLNAKN